MEIGGWITAGVLAVLLLNFFILYRRGASERNNLVTFILLTLLNDDVYQFQKQGLIKLIRETDAKNAADLSWKVLWSTTQLANQLGGSTTLASHGLIWQIKQGGTPG